MAVNRFAISSAEAIVALRTALREVPPTAPLLIHTDLMRLGMPDGRMKRDEIAEGWLEIFRTAADGRTVLIPTFNYDFTRTRLYDPAAAPGQVGSLSVHCARHYAARRTLTPIFNFCVFGEAAFDLGPVAHPFSAESAFGTLLRRDGAILFLGADMIANTFVHYVECAAEIGYRYLKRFPGTVVRDGRPEPIDFRFPVRPLAPGAVAYGDLGEADLRTAGLLPEFPIGLGRGLLVGARAYHDLIRARLAEDELHLLTPAARAITQRLYAEFGRPLLFERMETP
jgi:aminoglycoside N3'-acetyltransferase